VFIYAMQKLARDGALVLDGAFLRLPSHAVRLALGDEAAWEAIQPMLGGAERFRPPRVRDLAQATGRAEAEVRGLLKRASRMGWVDEAAHDHFFLRAAVREMTEIVADLGERTPEGAFTAAQFRDRVDNGRKVAIQILEFFDRHGLTLRRGDLRRVNRHRLDLFGGG
jgi:selenocysteine-specific elongation factor